MRKPHTQRLRASRCALRRTKLHVAQMAQPSVVARLSESVKGVSARGITRNHGR